MKPGDCLTFNIVSTSFDGRGIAKENGLVIFVNGAVEGDRVKAKVYTVHKSYATAGVTEIINYSPYRNENPCEYHGICGGCPLAHIKYEHQLKIKKQAVADAFTRIGRLSLEGVAFSETVGMETPYRYRNKMVFPTEDINGCPAGGFYASGSHDIVPINHCSAGSIVNISVLNAVLAFMKEQGIPSYNEKTKTGFIRRVFVRTGYHTNELMAVISSARQDIKNIDLLTQKLLQADLGEYVLKSVVLNINEKPNNLVLGDKNIVLYGNGFIEDKIFDLKFHISPHSFFQVNPIQTKKLYEKALEFAEITKNDTVMDIYCGIGTISLCAAKKAKHVIGVEIVPDAISDACENARRNNIKNAEFYCGSAEKTVPRLLEKYGSPDIVIIDPPRKGSDENTLNAILLSQPKRIVYISCNPSTLARDAKILCGGGYKIEKITPVDMFPHTAHVETVVQLVRKKPDTYIDITVDMDELDLTSSEAKATYDEIKDYIFDKHCVKVSSLYIAQIKQKHGIIERDCYNNSKKDNQKQPQCPPEKVKLIEEALRHFKMIS